MVCVRVAYFLLRAWSLSGCSSQHDKQTYLDQYLVFTLNTTSDLNPLIWIWLLIKTEMSIKTVLQSHLQAKLNLPSRIIYTMACILLLRSVTQDKWSSSQLLTQYQHFFGKAYVCLIQQACDPLPLQCVCPCGCRRMVGGIAGELAVILTGPMGKSGTTTRCCSVLLRGSMNAWTTL